MKKDGDVCSGSIEHFFTNAPKKIARLAAAKKRGKEGSAVLIFLGHIEALLLAWEEESI